MNNKRKNKNSYYTDSLTNIFIYLVISLAIIFITLSFFLVFRYLFINVFEIEKNISEFISIIISVAIVVIPSLHKIKNILRKITAVLQQFRYRLLRKNYIPHQYKKSNSQNAVIIKAIGMLQSTGGKIFSIEGESGIGKTMTSVFLLDDIGRNRNLLNLFIEFQKHIVYLDAGQEFCTITNLLSKIEMDSYSLVFIDNLQKLSLNKITTILEKIKSNFEYANEFGQTSLVVLMFQSNFANEQIKISLSTMFDKQFQNDNNYLFSLNEFQDTYVNNNQNYKKEYEKLLAFNDKLKSHLIVMYNSKGNNKLLQWLLDLFDDNINIKGIKNERKLFFTAAIVMLSKYTGFVDRKHLTKILSSASIKFNKFQVYHYTKMFSKSRFIQPFPLKKGSFIFNEMLSDEYRSMLVINELFCKYCNECSFSIFLDQTIYNSELKWLYLISSDIDDFKSIPFQTSEKLFYDCLDSLNINYILSNLETELKIDPKKNSLLQIELGILYIRTGKWKQARDILKPYVYKNKVSKDIWELQLQIIEADHGVNDEENYKVINKIINTSNDSYIVFQAKYWLAHINMEQGDFSLKVWEELQILISKNLMWKEKNTYSHFVHRITADTCRTYFLRGENKPSFFDCALKFFNSYKKHPETQEDLALLDLEKAHYIHYDLIYQLGIWNRYIFKHNKVLSKNDQLSLNNLIDDALQKYNLSISQFQQSGVKTWRTAQIRKDELSLALEEPNFIEVFSHLDDFEQYAIENHVDVFIGYVKCLQGKALSLCAYKKYIGIEDSSYDTYLENALAKLKESSETYKEYGNKYGELRSELLYALVDVTTKFNSNSTEDINTILDNFIVRIKELKHKFNNDNLRENQIVNYLLSLKSLKIQDIIKIITYYPIVLQ